MIVDLRLVHQVFLMLIIWIMQCQSIALFLLLTPHHFSWQQIGKIAVKNIVFYNCKKHLKILWCFQFCNWTSKIQLWRAEERKIYQIAETLLNLHISFPNPYETFGLDLNTVGTLLNLVFRLTYRYRNV